MKGFVLFLLAGALAVCGARAQDSSAPVLSGVPGGGAGKAATDAAKTRIPIKIKLSYGPPKATGSATAFPAPVPAPADPRSQPFKSVVISVDKAHQIFRMGKKKIRAVRVVETSKLFRGDGTTAATFADIVVGVEIRGSLKKMDDGSFDAVSLKIGPKTPPPSTTASSEGDAIP